jgi:hypothetical protein
MLLVLVFNAFYEIMEYHILYFEPDVLCKLPILLQRFIPVGKPFLQISLTFLVLKLHLPGQKLREFVCQKIATFAAFKYKEI